MSARSPSNAQTRFAASHSSALVELRFNLTPITETVCFTSEGEKDSATQRILSLITRFRETLGKIDTVPSRTIDRTIDSHASIYFGTPEDRRHPLTGNTDELATAYELFLEALLSDVQRENPDSSAAPEPYNPEDLSTYAQKYPRARHVIRHLRVTISGEDDPEHEAFVQSFASTPDAIYVAANTATAREIYTQLRSSDRASNFLTFAALFDGRNTQAGARYVTTRRTYLHALTLPNPKIDFTAPTFFERAEDFIDFNVSGLVTDVLLASPAQDVFIHSTRDGLPYLEALSVLTDDKLTISDTSPGRQPIYALEAAPYNALHICFCETDLIREYGRLCQAFNEHKLAAEPRLLPDNIPDDLAAEIMTEYKNGKAIVVATPAIAYQPNISADIILFREPGTLGPDNPVVTAQVRNLVERARPQYILTLTSEESLKVESALSTQNQIDTAKNRPRLPITPRVKLNGTARYTVPMGSAKVYGQGVVSYQSSASSDIRTAIYETFSGNIISPAAQLGRLKAFTTANFALGAEFKDFSIELFIENAFDARGQLSRFQECGSCGQRPYIVSDRPQTVGLRLGSKF